MKKWLKEHSMTSVVLLSLLVEFTLETLFRHTPVKALLFVWQKPHLFLLNSLIVLVTYSISFPFRKRFAIKTTVTLLWLTFGVTNFVISLYRRLPFTMVDVLLVKALFSLIDVYFNPFQIFLMFAALIGVAAAIVLLFVKTKKQTRLPWSTWLPGVVAPALLALMLCFVGVSTGALDSTFANLYDSYNENGFAYCFVCTFADVGMKKPDTYSPETISELDKEIFEESSNGDDGREMPNIIYLQLESFIDLTKVAGIELEEDPAPTYTALKAACPSGYLSVPTSGGGTVNTEMEILTGMDIDFFGAGEYPYYTILRETCCESLAYDLAALGYTPTAIHDNSGSFYSRHEVYSHLGFTRFDSVEYMPGVTYTPLGWARDEVLQGEILEALRSTPGRDFLFTVAVQTHGSYPTEPDNGRSLLDLGAGEEGVNPFSLEYYSAQQKEVDAFLADLTSALSEWDEPVVLVVYGDHMPAMNITDEMLDPTDLFTTEYVIWSNYDLDAPDMNLEAYQLSAHVLETLGMDCGTLFYFHQTQSENPSYLDDLNLLQYDMLYGDHSIYNGEMPYPATDLAMGLRTISLDEAKMQYGYLSVTGSGFTPYSRVYIDDELQDTLYISDSQLIVAEYEPTYEETVCVGQVSDDEIALSSTRSVSIEP